MSRMSQWLAVALSTWFTWLCYVTGTLQGTEAQADLVPWIVWILFLVALNSLRMDNEFLVQLRPKSHWLKAGADINILAQIFLLVASGHWFLGFLRGIAEVIARGKCNYAHSEILWQQGRDTEASRRVESGADLPHQ